MLDLLISGLGHQSRLTYTILIPPLLPSSTAFMPTVGPSTAQKRAAHAASHAVAILNIAPPMTELQSDHILPLPPDHASPLAPHVVAKFTAWLEEDNHPNRALCQEDSEVSPRPIYGRNFVNHCTLILYVAH
jgi:hypothetical protein